MMRLFGAVDRESVGRWTVSLTDAVASALNVGPEKTAARNRTQSSRGISIPQAVAPGPLIGMKIGPGADEQVVLLRQLTQIGALGLGKGGVDGFEAIQSQRFQLRHAGIQPCRIGFIDQGMRPERLSAGAVEQGDRLADLPAGHRARR